VGQVAEIGTRLIAFRLTPQERAEFAVLAALLEFGALGQMDLYRHVQMRAESLTALLTGLQQQGHVARRIDAADRRRSVLALTVSGHRRFEELRQQLDQVQTVFLRGLDVREQEQLRVLLAKLVDAHGTLP